MEKIKKEIKILNKRSKKIFNLRKFNFKINFNINSTVTLGQYKRLYKDGSQKHFIQLNPKLLELKFKDLYEVLLHEYAHYITYRIYGSRILAHGREWRMVMSALNAKNISATTSIASKIKRKDSDVKVKCNCKEKYISKNRYTRMKNGTTYRCSICKKKIKTI